MNNMVPFDGNWHKNLEESFQALMDEMLSSFGKRTNPYVSFPSKSSFPKVNILQKDEDIILEVAIPHYHPENVEVSVESGILTVKGDAVTTDSKDGTYLVREVAKRAFSRSFQLPEGTTEEQIHARYDHGVLYVTVKGVAKKVAPKKVVKKIEIGK